MRLVICLVNKEIHSVIKCCKSQVREIIQEQFLNNGIRKFKIEKEQEGLDYGLAREFDREIRLRIVMMVQKMTRDEAEMLCMSDINLPF